MLKRGNTVNTNNLENTNNTNNSASEEESESEEELEPDEVSISPDVVIDVDSDYDIDEDIVEILDNGNTESRIVREITACIIYTKNFENKKMRVAPTPRGAPLDSMQQIDKDGVDENQCLICMKRFSNQFRMDQHVCKGVLGQRDLLYFSTKYTLERIDQPDFKLLVANATDSIDIFSFADGQVLEDNCFKGGWACSKQQGQKYGHIYIGPFQKDVEDMFKAGLEDISKRLGPGQMLHHLKKTISRAFDPPSETEI